MFFGLRLSSFTQDNNYAFCKVQKNKFLKIKEKESFTKKWQSEPLSVGLFYFVSGSELINCCEKIFKHQITINNEYFPSLLFNFIKNKKVKFVKTSLILENLYIMKFLRSGNITC